MNGNNPINNKTTTVDLGLSLSYNIFGFRGVSF